MSSVALPKPESHSRRRLAPIHSRVKGRSRFAVEGLKGNRGLKNFIERRLHGQEIHHVAASDVTGRILVLHNESISVSDIDEMIQQVLSAEIANAANGASFPEFEWHLKSREEVCTELETGTRGLSPAEAGSRLAREGTNDLVPSIRRSNGEILINQFQSLPVAMLGVSAAVSVATGGIVDAVVIAGVIALNAAIGYVTEGHAEHTINALKEHGQATAHVVRESRPTEIAASEIVRGDVVELRAGMAVPADARVIESHSLSVSEATLTGESAPINKSAEPLAPGEHLLADRRNMVYRGTLVTGGWGRAVVVATGHNTELGKIQLSIDQAHSPPTPMQRQLDQLGRQLVMASLVSAAGVFAIAAARGQGLVPALKLAISLAVAAVPEGLPMTATTTLARGIGDLRSKGILVRRLSAVEGLASIQLICFDKTGTLTFNRMSVVRIRTIDADYSFIDNRIRKKDETSHQIGANADPALRRLLEVCALCNDAETSSQTQGEARLGSSTEIALLNTVEAGGIDIKALRAANPRLSLRERSEEQLYMATTHRSREGQQWVAVKGSPCEVLDLCNIIAMKGAHQELNDELRQAIARQNHSLSEAGLRVLGVARAPDGGDSPEFEWLGLVALADPVRPEAHRTVATFHEAGISTVMITGDQAVTAAAIAQDLGLDETGGDGDGALEELLRDFGSVSGHAFSRVTPGQKLKIIEALQSTGLVVAMAGDGINDAPSLRAADVGIALGGGTETARQSSDVILVEDELQGLVTAIETGRATYDNIERAVNYLLATNASEIAITLTVTASGFGQALTPVQLLWLNLVTDVLPAIGLAAEPPAPDLMGRRPRDPSEEFMTRDLAKTLGREAAIMTATTLAAQIYALRRHGASPRSGAVVFTSLVSAQLLHALRYRSGRGHQPGSAARSDYLSMGLAISFTLQAAALFVPGLRRLFGGPIDLLDTAVALSCGASSLALSSFAATSGRRDSIP